MFKSSKFYHRMWYVKKRNIRFYNALFRFILIIFILGIMSYYIRVF